MWLLFLRVKYIFLTLYSTLNSNAKYFVAGALRSRPDYAAHWHTMLMVRFPHLPCCRWRSYSQNGVAIANGIYQTVGHQVVSLDVFIKFNWISTVSVCPGLIWKAREEREKEREQLHSGATWLTPGVGKVNDCRPVALIWMRLWDKNRSVCFLVFWTMIICFMRSLNKLRKVSLVCKNSWK